MDKYIFTSESVSDGHPDKVSDQISDALVDAGLALGDRTTRIAIETLVSTNHVALAGEVKNFNVVDINQIVRDGMLTSYKFSDELNKDIIDFMILKSARLREISLRMVLKIADLAQMSPKTWKELAESTCMTRVTFK